MTSAAAEKEINKWCLWGINKLLQVNSPLSLKSGDGSPTLDLVEGIFCEDRQQAKKLLEEAQSSLKNLDMKWVIYGAYRFNQLWPLKKSTETSESGLRPTDIFRTFGKKEHQGQNLYKEAQEAYQQFLSVRGKNKMPSSRFCDEFVPQELLTYCPSSTIDGLPNGGKEERTENGHPSFEVTLMYSSQLYNDLPNTARTLFELIKHTSEEDYRQSSMGWDDERKIEEMKDADMRYLIVRIEGSHAPTLEQQWSDDAKTDQSVIGFLSFMITEEEEEEVIYIYEIHISEHFRDSGLGRHLFRMVEHIGKAAGMDKAMLTVFRRNRHARKWYASRGYEEDEISPRPRKLRGGRSIIPDYEILSKHLQDQENKRLKQ